jgi:hypothetical protein
VPYTVPYTGHGAVLARRPPDPHQVSDVAARGLDVDGCDAVFNLELPSSAAHYAHRAGRTGEPLHCVNV